MQTSCWCADKNTRKTYLELLHELKFDDFNPVLGGDRVNKAIFCYYITGENVVYNLRVGYCLHKLVQAWLTDPGSSPSMN